jgi:hypothetical protein
VRCDGVMVLSVDSMIVIVITVIDNVTGIMGEGLGKGSETNVIGLTEDGGHCGTLKSFWA